MRREVELRRAEPSYWFPVRQIAGRVRRTLHGPTDVENAAQEAARLFGAHRRHEEGTISSSETLFVDTWRPGADQFDEAIDWAVRHAKLPDYGFGIPPCASIESTFNLRDPRTGDVLPYQGPQHYMRYDFSGGYGSLLGRSTLYARFSERTTVSVVLCLPFEAVTSEASAFASELQARLPFRMSRNQWKLWELNRNGAGYRPVKVQVL